MEKSRETVKRQKPPEWRPVYRKPKSDLQGKRKANEAPLLVETPEEPMQVPQVQIQQSRKNSTILPPPLAEGAIPQTSAPHKAPEHYYPPPR